MARPRKATKMSAQHKMALAEGRQLSRAVRNYLEALEANKPRRGRKRTPESIRKRLAQIEAQFDSANAITRLELRQEEFDLQNELAAMEQGAGVDMAELEKEFIASAAAYGERKGITYAVWREAGVPAAVLKEAGITRAQT